MPVDLDVQFALVQDEEGTGIVILLHEVVALVDPAEAELVEEVLLHGAVLDEGGEGEMGGEALEDEGFVDKTFLLLDGCKVFVYLRFVAGKLDGKVFFILPAALQSSIFIPPFRHRRPSRTPIAASGPSTNSTIWFCFASTQLL